MANALAKLLLFLALFVAGEIHVTFSLTDSNDAELLASLKDELRNTPPSWNNSTDPCGSWEGLTCDENGRVTALAVENGHLQGSFPQDIFCLTQIQQVLLSNNRIDDALPLTGYISPQLQLLDLQNNQISAFGYDYYHNYTFEVRLAGNPVCHNRNNSFCQPQQNLTQRYSTSLANCNGSIQCPAQEKLSPGNCQCAFPYEGLMIFTAPALRDLSNAAAFQSLETSLWEDLSLSPGSVFLQNPFFNILDYLHLQVALFPASGKYFNRSEIERIGYELANQIYKPPQVFGPYNFVASPYPFP